MNNFLKTFLITLITLIACSTSIYANKINESQARALAGDFFGVTMPITETAVKAKALNGNTAYYVFNNPEQPGWVIISGDDRTRTVLAYSDEDYFDSDQVPECVQDWLDTYAYQIANIKTTSESISTTTSVNASNKSRIAPMLMCNMAQGLPYNQQCPTVSATNSNHCVAGCVAIAMAQIMHYYKSSTKCLEIPAYTPTGMSELPALPATTFNYSIINDWYDNAENTTAGAQEVAKLVRYCGQSVLMKYGEETSSATSQRNAFVYYFGFDKDAMQIKREDVTAAEWENLFYTELSNGRPVYISARKSSGGHAFVCDGYNGDGLYHINWGWRGHKNGYFALNALTDDNAGGTGAASGDEGYTLNMQIMVGLQPSTGKTTNTDGNTVALYKDNMVNTTSYSRSGSNVNFTGIDPVAYYWNNSSQSYTYDLGWGLYDSSNNLISTHIVVSNKTLQPTYYTYPTASMSMGKGITSGVYYLKPICRISGTSKFNLCRGANVNYIKATITATNMVFESFNSLNNQNLKINSVTTSSIRKVGSPMPINLGVTNSGLTDYNYIYMWVDGTLVSATTTDLAIGQSGTVTMTYTPSAAGSKTFKFTADEEGTKILKTTNITINSATSATITYVGDVTGSVSGTTFNASITVKNSNTNTYNDYIVARLFKKEPNSGNTGYLCGAKSQSVYLGYNNSTALNFAFDNLEIGESYFVIFYYYSNGERVRITATTTSTINSPYNLLDVNQDNAVNSADVTAAYSVILGMSNRFRKYADVNGDGVVNASDITAIYNKILNKN